MPLGSSIAFTPRMISIAFSGLEYDSSFGFIAPTPCSAETDPLASAVNSYTKGSISLSRAGWYPVGELTFRCKLPSPRCPYPITETELKSKRFFSEFVSSTSPSVTRLATRARSASTKSYIDSVGRLRSYLYVAPACFSARETRSRKFQSANACFSFLPTKEAVTRPRRDNNAANVSNRRRAFFRAAEASSPPVSATSQTT
mmetsp:Transcript_13991/g.58896  ORF Transcript_13991/g.58896 Transcript_13991/m.58896 type:complete len:201 (-) Transcript_13991:977-1579(-)